MEKSLEKARKMFSMACPVTSLSTATPQPALTNQSGALNTNILKSGIENPFRIFVRKC